MNEICDQQLCQLKCQAGPEDRFLLFNVKDWRGARVIKMTMCQDYAVNFLWWHMHWKAGFVINHDTVI